jgi:hypothetical protein
MPGSTPVFGFPYPDPSDLVANYPALGQQLAEDVEDEIIASGGLGFVTAQTFTTTAAVNINNCFTATYQNYRILIRVAGSSASTLNARMRLAGTDATGADYDYAQRFATSAGATGDQGSAANQTAFVTTSVSGVISSLALDIAAPATATTTDLFGVYVYASTAVFYGGTHKLATAYDGISFYPAAGTITGSIRVYGYKNS